MNIVALGAEQVNALITFFGRLPDEDLTLMREDVTEPDIVHGWAGHPAHWVALDDDAVVGFAAVRPLPGWSDHVGELRLVVDSAHRRAGIGRTLARHALTDAVRAGRRKIVVELAADQEHAPGYLLYLTDPARAVIDYTLLTYATPLLAALPRGDGHPVLVLPRLHATDVSTITLRTILKGLGYWTYGWQLGRNIGPTSKVVHGMPDEPSPRAENIAVLASHFGIAHHPAALWAVADRLAQPADQWKPFQPPPLLRTAYLAPER